MNEKVLSEVSFDELGKASRRAALVSLVGILIVLGGMAYAIFNLSRLERQRQLLEIEKKSLADSVKNVETRTRELQQTEESVLDFLGGVTSKEKFRLIDPSVDWPRTKATILAMDAGPRKSAVLDAILLAWKNLPFSLEDRSLGRGLDSSHFMNVVLSSTGVHVQQRKDERLSDAMMGQFQKVDSPLPGDLIFYHGNVGSFVLMYIGPGSPEGKGVAIGTLQTGEEVMVLDTKNVNASVYPFIGFFRVPYPSMTVQ
jgi:NlpC/P60 family